MMVREFNVSKSEAVGEVVLVLDIGPYQFEIPFIIVDSYPCSLCYWDVHESILQENPIQTTPESEIHQTRQVHHYHGSKRDHNPLLSSNPIYRQIRDSRE